MQLYYYAIKFIVTLIIMCDITSIHWLNFNLYNVFQRRD